MANKFLYVTAIGFAAIGGALLLNGSTAPGIITLVFSMGWGSGFFFNSCDEQPENANESRGTFL